MVMLRLYCGVRHVVELLRSALSGIREACDPRYSTQRNSCVGMSSTPGSARHRRSQGRPSLLMAVYLPA